MKFSATYSIPASREVVYNALIDPVILQACIEGCEKMTHTGNDVYVAELKIGIAAIKGKYTGKVSLTEKTPPSSFTMSMEGKGLPGWVRGQAAMHFADKVGSTEIKCDCDAQVGGLIAAIGSRLIEAAAKKMMDDFFAKLRVQLS